MRSITRILTLAIATTGLMLSGPLLAGDIGIPGTYNPATGTFTPRTDHVLAATGTTETLTGTIKITITVALASSIPADQTISCTATAATYDASYSNSSSTSSNLVRGAKNTCTMTIPYEWTIASKSDLVNVQVTLSTGSTYGIVDGVSRSSNHSFAAFALPKDGATTTLSLNDSL